MKSLTEKKKIKLLDTEYEVSFPTMGQYNKIETLKSVLTNGNYGSMAISAVGITTQERALDAIDAYCTFSVIIPNFNKIFGEFEYIDMLKSRKMTLAYNKYYKPWHDIIMKELNEVEQDFDVIEELSKETADGE
jgi:hypothetical protein